MPVTLRRRASHLVSEVFVVDEVGLVDRARRHREAIVDGVGEQLVARCMPERQIDECPQDVAACEGRAYEAGDWPGRIKRSTKSFSSSVR